LTITFGDKISSFEIENRSGDVEFSFKSTEEKGVKGDFPAKSYVTLLEKGETIQKMKSNNGDLCPRKLIILTAKNRTATIQKSLGCIGSDTLISKNLVSLADALNQLLP
jgi:hypothetical protein